MTDLRSYQPSFTAGELSPALWARVDLAKYAVGLKTARNLFIHPHGGASNRAGMEFCGEVKTSANVTRLIPFQFNTEQTYVLEFGNLYMRVWKDGGVILSGMSPYEIVTPFTSAQLFDLVFVQEADVMYIVHPSHAPRKLSRTTETNWTLTTITFAPSISAPTGLTVQASYALPTTGASSSLSFEVTSVNASDEESIGSSTVSVSYPYENPGGRFMKISWTAATGAARYRIYKTAGDGTEGLVGESTTTEVEIRTHNGDNTRLVPGVADPGAPAAPTGVTATLEFGQTYRYKVSAVSSANGDESLPSSAVSIINDMAFRGNKNYLSWSAVSGADSYLIYREDAGVYGYVGRSETTSFTDENIVPDLANGPQEARNPFTGAGNYPSCCTFVEQRLAFASSNNDPQAVWMSQSANYENFGVSSPAKASDAVTFRIRSRQVNQVRALLPFRGLMLLTSGGEFLVSGGSQSDAITPSAIKIDPQGYRGAAKVQPIVVGNTVLFAQNRGGVVRDFSYEFAEDSFAGKDLTVLARHLFEGRSIKAWAYSQAPYSIVWVVLDNGMLVALTYMKEHDVWGWSRMDTDGTVEDVTVINEGEEDVPYFIVKRTIGSSDKRYIERLHTREFSSVEEAFFVDSGLTYSGVAADVISGLDHLEGKEVVALADGNVVRGLTVTAGAITLPFEAELAHIGLPYSATLKTLDLDLGSVRGLGSVQGRQKSVAEMTLRVEETRGIWVGTVDDTRESGKLVEYKQRSTEPWGDAIELFTGDIQITPMADWTTGANVVISQFDPLPMTILAVMPDLALGR